MIKAVLAIVSMLMLSSCATTHRTAGLVSPHSDSLSARAPLIMTSGTYWQEEADTRMTLPITGEYYPELEGGNGATILRPVYVSPPEK